MAWADLTSRTMLVRPAFEEWKERVDRFIYDSILVRCDHLPDEDYWTAWDEGVRAHEMAILVMCNNGYCDLDGNHYDR